MVILVPEKRKRSEGATVPENLKRRKTIADFFPKKLLREESLVQAQQQLVCAAEEREDWLDDEELQQRKARRTRCEANKFSQQKRRAKKWAEQIVDGVRNANGKIKKVHECMLWKFKANH